MNVIAHNLLAMNAQRQYGINTGLKAKITEKLAFGYKVNRAADDAASLTIFENVRARIRDTDMVKEMVDYTKLNVLEQVGQGMIAQANQSTQGLDLLQ